MIMKNPTRN